METATNDRAIGEVMREFSHPPEGFMPPPLHPAGVRLETRTLGKDVYALISDTVPADNNGFIVGERCVLVIDAHINRAMAQQIQDAVAAATDKPILYLVNTNFHGDHTFGNEAFSETTRIVAHRATAERMRHFHEEKQFMLQTVDHDRSVFMDAEPRLPDLVFDDFLQLELGGRIVELHHFGSGNTSGDTVVFEPQTRTVWTGNLILGEGSIPFLIEGGAARYLKTMAALAARLDIDNVVPGHGQMCSGAVAGRYLHYLCDLLEYVRKSFRAGRTLEDTLAAGELSEAYALPADSPMGDFFKGIHRWNVQQTWLELNRRTNGGGAGR